VVPFRGTVEWSSGHAAKGRDQVANLHWKLKTKIPHQHLQSRFDDLIGWFYVIVELFGPEFTANDLDPRPFPWNYCENHSKVRREWILLWNFTKHSTFLFQACRYLKSVYTPARLLLRHW